MQDTGVDDDGADIPLGTIDSSGVPIGLDLSAFPGAAGAPTPAADGPTFAAGFSCVYQCIKSGVAYPRGFGALLVVETHVPARLWIGVSDANNDYVGHTTSNGRVTEFSFALDHLDPGQTYYAIVAATDENNDTEHRYGSITTLSQRTVTIEIGYPSVTGGPTNIVYTSTWVRSLTSATATWICPEAAASTTASPGTSISRCS